MECGLASFEGTRLGVGPAGRREYDAARDERSALAQCNVIRNVNDHVQLIRAAVRLILSWCVGGWLALFPVDEPTCESGARDRSLDSAPISLLSPALINTSLAVCLCAALSTPQAAPASGAGKRAQLERIHSVLHSGIATRGRPAGGAIKWLKSGRDSPSRRLDESNRATRRAKRKRVGASSSLPSKRASRVAPLPAMAVSRSCGPRTGRGTGAASGRGEKAREQSRKTTPARESCRATDRQDRTHANGGLNAQFTIGWRGSA